MLITSIGLLTYLKNTFQWLSNTVPHHKYNLMKHTVRTAR